MTYRRVSLGRPAVFFLPKDKLTDDLYRRLTDFLLEAFGGYTVTTGNLKGYWRDEDDKVHAGDHYGFRVSFQGKERIPQLEEFLANLAREIGEQCIYIETGEDSWLIYHETGKSAD